MEFLIALLSSFGETLIRVSPYVIVSALVFPILSCFFACNPNKPWWRNPDVATDLAYWFVVPVFTRFLRIGLAVLGAGLIFGIEGETDLIAFFQHGHGPLAELPLWLQTVLYLVMSDFLLY